MLPQSTRFAAAKAAMASATVSRVISSGVATSVFRRCDGNSFANFKEYRENAKTYGPLSASLATRRHLAHVPKF